MPKVKINYEQLPIKAHYFFFMAAMGPILPFLSVYGRQLGVSTIAMGTITAILPILYLLSKPIFGFLVDHFRDWRKSIFMAVLVGGSLSFALLYFLPKIPEFTVDIERNISFTRSLMCGGLGPCANQDSNVCGKIYKAKINCGHKCNVTDHEFSISIKLLDLDGIHLYPECLLVNEFNESDIIPPICDEHLDCSLKCNVDQEGIDTVDMCLYTSCTFWVFVLLFSLGSVGFNVTNSISDAICFDVLGDGGHTGYGRQRVWGTIGFGITALLAGWIMDYVSRGHAIKSYGPAFLLVITFTIIDVLCCTKLKLPIISGSKNIIKEVFGLLKQKAIATFLIFATIAGVLDSFIIYFLFWYLEDLADKTHHNDQIKLIEGLIVAAETLGGEVIFFTFSGKILKKFGYGCSMTFCFVCYALRMWLISLVPNPWWAIPVEFLMQGPTYALMYTIIVGFASVVAPPGTSATVQGIVAGMDDGLGFAIGSLIGGILYKQVGGKTTLQILSIVAGVTAVAYLITYLTILKEAMPKTRKKQNEEIDWKNPEDAARDCQTA